MDWCLFQKIPIWTRFPPKMWWLSPGQDVRRPVASSLHSPLGLPQQSWGVPPDLWCPFYLPRIMFLQHWTHDANEKIRESSLLPYNFFPILFPDASLYTCRWSLHPSSNLRRMCDRRTERETEERRRRIALLQLVLFKYNLQFCLYVLSAHRHIIVYVLGTIYWIN